MPKKSLGQNFLKSKQAIVDMIRAAGISAGENILEIGPGKGVLTEALLEAGGNVLAVEFDTELIPELEEIFEAQIEDKKLKIIQGDVLDIKPEKLFDKKIGYKIVANIPYYITGAIIRKFLEADLQPRSMALLVQKEVAERIVARDGKASILSISVQAYGEPKYIGKVSARYFTPAPKVDSAILFIDKISKKNFKDISEENFFQVVKLAFGQKRKTLIKNLSQTFENKPSLLEIFARLGVPEQARAEDLSFETMLGLSKELFPQKTKRK